MKISELCNKAFIGGHWMVGILDSRSESMIYKKVQTSRDQWIADPFLYEEDGRHFLFVEQYFNKLNRAGLGVYEIADGKPINNSIIIEKPYHMSYPCVFKYNGHHWMIPESSSNQSLDIYKALDFPFKWKHERTLIHGRRVVDTTVFVQDNEVFLLSYEKVKDGWRLLVYFLNMIDYSLSKVGESLYSTNVGRPAGGLFKKDGRLYRPAQNCSSKYGESLYMYEVLELKRDSYKEQLAYEIKCNDVQFDERFERIHTLNKDSRYEVIDVFQERFDLFHWWKIFKRKYLKS